MFFTRDHQFSNHPESLPRSVIKSSESINLISGAEHPKISWVVVKTWIWCYLLHCPTPQIILHCPPHVHTHVPRRVNKPEQAEMRICSVALDIWSAPVSWGLSTLPCSSSNKDSPRKNTKLTQSTRYSWRPKGIWKTQPERSWVLLLPTPVPFCMTQNCLFTLPPNLFSPIYGIHNHLPGIFH